MPRALWLPEVLAKAGCKVGTVPGWETLGSATFDPEVVVWHHTATGANWSRAALVKLIRNGRSDLRGPLSQLILDRDGTYLVVAAGRANHAGAGGWRGVSGNTNALGIEAANDGRGEPWPAPQVEAYRRGTAAILARLGRDEGWMCGHKEWAPTRKVDPRGLDMDHERAAVAALLSPAPEPQEDDYMFVTTASTSTVWFLTGGVRVRLTAAKQADELDPKWRAKLRVLSSGHPVFKVPEVRA